MVDQSVQISIQTEEKACLMAFTSKIKEAQSNWGGNQRIDCVAYYKCSSCKRWSYKGSCSVSCGHWHLLRFTPEELESLSQNKEKASINLIEHLEELVPNNTWGKVGLVTYQNGINNNYPRDFAQMGNAIKSNIKESPLCIGIYNQSYSILPDLVRLQCEFCCIRTAVVRTNRKMFTTLANRLRNRNPHPHWLHICHSEGGRIAHDTLIAHNKGTLDVNTMAFCKGHLIVHTYGSVQPIPNWVAKEALNTYATHDVAYRMYGTRYEKNPDYVIKVVDSKEKPYSPIPGDHGFLGVTYPGALKDNIDQTRVRYKIYDAKM